MGLQLGAKTKSKGIWQGVVENIEKKAVWLKEATPVLWWENKFNKQHLRFFAKLDDVSVSHAEKDGERESWTSSFWEEYEKPIQLKLEDGKRILFWQETGS